MGGRPPGIRGGGTHPGDRPRWVAPGAGQAPGEQPGESPPWTAWPATRACRFGGAPGGVMVREPLISPLLAGPLFCPDPSPSPLPAACGWVALGPRGALRVEGSFGRDGSPGSPGGTGPRFTSPLPPRASPPPQTPCTAPHGAYPCPGWIQSEGSKGSRDGVPWIPSFFSKPRGRLLPAPSHPPPLPQGTSLGFFVKLPGHLGQRAPRCEILRFGAWSADLGQILGWGGRVAFPGEKALLGVGPGVRRVQTCCWGAAHLILEAAGVGGWKWSHIFDQSHLGTKSASGRPRHSDFQAFAKDVPPGARMAGEEAAELRALAWWSTHARSSELSFTCSALQLFSSAPWGTASPPLCPGGCPGPPATLDP